MLNLGLDNDTRLISVDYFRVSNMKECKIFLLFDLEKDHGCSYEGTRQS